MEHNVFNRLLEKRLEKIKSILACKSLEYADEDDRLHNFKSAARAFECSNAMALWGMMLKHYVSIQDMVKQTEKTGKIHSVKMIDEKIGDMINYLILLEAVFLEPLVNIPVDISDNLPQSIIMAASKLKGIELRGSVIPKTKSPRGFPNIKKTTKKVKRVFRINK